MIMILLYLLTVSGMGVVFKYALGQAGRAVLEIQFIKST